MNFQVHRTKVKVTRRLSLKMGSKCVTRFLFRLSFDFFFKFSQMIFYDLLKCCIHFWVQRSRSQGNKIEKPEVLISLSFLIRFFLIWSDDILLLVEELYTFWCAKVKGQCHKETK